MIPPLSPLSWVALAIMVLALVAALSRRFLATGALLVANLAIFLIMLLGPQATVLHAGADDVDITGEHLRVVQTDLSLYSTNLLELHPLGFLQLFSSMFVHWDILHILGNMIFLWAFGMPFEERIGARRFVAIYLVAGLVGSLAQLMVGNFLGEGATLLLGASGAIFGIMCAFATKYPNQVVGVPVPLLFIFIRIPMRVVFGALLWVGYDLLQATVLSGNRLGDGVGHYAHYAGGAAGAVMALLILRHVSTAKGGGSRIAIDLVALGDFAHDGPTRTVLAHMRQNNDEPEVFQAWLDKFFRTATCPTCKHRVMPRHRGEVVCSQGHSFDVRQDRTRKLAPTAQL